MMQRGLVMMQCPLEPSLFSKLVVLESVASCLVMHGFTAGCDN